MHALMETISISTPMVLTYHIGPKKHAFLMLVLWTFYQQIDIDYHIIKRKE